MVAQAVSPAAQQTESLPRLAAAPDYFPLFPGNVWIYQGAGVRAEGSMTIEVGAWAYLGGRGYFKLRVSPGGEYWVRMTESGSLVAYDPMRQLEEPWYNFQAPEGQPYVTALPGVCCGRAVVQSRNAPYRGPIGEFDRALEMRYPGTFQVGIDQELFLPYVGLVHRTVATGGPSTATYDLIYARLGGGITRISAGELAFGLTLDKSVYYVNLMPPIDPSQVAPVLRARLTLRNTAEPIELIFPSGQSFDLVISNDRGQVVYRWSDGKFFTMAVRQEIFGPGERDHVIETRLADRNGTPFPEGRYVAEGWLTTMGRRAFAASVGFEVKHLH